MGFRFSPYAVPLFLAALMTASLAAYAFRQRRQPMVVTFGLMMVAFSWWALLYGLHISGANPETQYLANRLKYFGALTAPALWLTLALQYTQHEKVLPRRSLAFIFFPVPILIPIVLTDPYTHLWWSEIWTETWRGQLVLCNRHGILYYASVIWSYLLIGWSAWLYLKLYRRGGRIYRQQASLMVLASALPVLANMITQLGLSPLPWGLDAFFFSLSSVPIALALFWFRFLDITPVAHQAVMDQIPEGVIVIDSAGRVVDLNPTASRLIGTGNTPSVGQPLHQAIQQPELREALAGLSAADSPERLEQDVFLGDMVLSLSSASLFRKDRQTVGKIIMLRDISERIAVQQKLMALYRQTEEERRRLALTIQNASDGIVLLDAQGQVLACNPAAELIVGAQGRPGFPPALQTMLAAAENSQDEIHRSEITLGEQSFHVTVTPVTTGGLVLTMHDVTHFKQLSRLKDEFVATVSHDLRTPLSTILGYAQLLQEGNMTSARQLEALEHMEAGARQMIKLINGLLDLAALETGLQQQSEPVELDILALQAVEFLADAARAKNLDIVLDLHDHPPLLGDPRLLTQLWRNLVDNAIKYTACGRITIRVRSEDTHVLGQVHDTGIGISPTEVPYIFHKFFRTQSGTRTADGSGLGLALAKTIVEKHGGQLWVESEPNAGSVFSFMLPISVE